MLIASELRHETFPVVGEGSWLCENEIRFGRHAEQKKDFYVFLLSA
jgi:hypothetical protein